MIPLAPLAPPAAGLGLIVALLASAHLSTPAVVMPLARVAPAAPAVVDTVDAASGGLTGGELVAITGSGLSAVTAVTVDGRDARIVQRSNAELTVEMPHSWSYVSGETVPLEVVTDHVIASADYTYLALTPVDRQLEYAFRHWDDYNLAYFGDFTTWGGDCQNFVSQTLVARGWPLTPDWFNAAQEDWAPAFVHVPSFDEWLAAQPYGAQRVGMDDIERVQLGDVVMFDWDGDGSLDHAQVVSDISEGEDGQPVIAMVGHDRNSDYRTIESALQEQGTDAATVHFWLLP